MTDDDALFGRDDQLAVVDTALSASTPAYLMFEGSPGVGKTALLGRAVELAAGRGYRVLRAQAHPLEQDYAFGLVRQLLQPVVAELSEPARAELFGGVVAPAAAVVWPGAGAPTDAPLAVLRGLYWLVVRLAEQAPLMLVVDDVQWADAASLRGFVYLAGAGDDVPVSLMVARTTGMRGTEERLVGALARRLSTVDISGLSDADVAAFAHTVFAVEPEPAFVAACQRVTGGNPFLLRELMTSLDERGTRPTREAIAELTEFSPQRVSSWVLTRLRRAEPGGAKDCVAVARAVAILDDGADVPLVATLAGLASDAIVRAADTLARLGVLRHGSPLRFVHSIVRAAVDSEIGPSQRRAAHALAARTLATQGLAEQVSAHLLVCDVIGEPWAVDSLRAAARIALRRGAAESAVRYLKRALAERPSEGVRLGVLAELGRAELGIDVRASVEHLGEAFDGAHDLPPELAPDPEFVMGMATDLTIASATNGTWTMACDVLDRASAALAGAPELVSALQAFAVAAGVGIPGFPQADRLARLRETAAPYPGSALMAAVLTAHHLSGLGRSREEAVRLALLAREAVPAHSVPGLVAHMFGAIALYRADEFDSAIEFCDVMMAGAPVLGQPLFAEVGHAFRSVVAFHAGRLADAVGEAQAAVDIRDGLLGGSPLPSGWEGYLVRAHIERGDIESAERVMASAGPPETWQSTYFANWLWYGRGLVRAERGELDAALADFLECGRRLAEHDVLNPAEIAWRTRAAMVAYRLGRTDEATRLAAEELDAARAWGAPRSIGMALRVLGQVTRDVDALADSVAVLENTPMRLIHAYSLFHMGLAHHRAGRRGDARTALAEANRLADEYGSIRLAEYSAAALERIGGRRPNAPRFGTDALTAQERRIAERVADGASNREVAEELFLTLRTVEHHLTATYRKLGIDGRRALPAALAER
nr:AAA family ATPase [Kibdelosporangium sp. MJ126-NF4]CEL21551.1 putative transcriptional regulatory protein [Kibdelosporangium sp. MJ126-NF4]CTQ95882.1 putative transcriptional regulatory protein [Kibdelosporangium sp. MJ126-NF4]